MERYQTLRAYSAGGVVFRLALVCSSENKFAKGMCYQQLQVSDSSSIEVVLVGRSQSGIGLYQKEHLNQAKQLSK